MATATTKRMCALCETSMDPEEKAAAFPCKCGAFHRACLDDWLARYETLGLAPTCPLCRRWTRSDSTEAQPASPHRWWQPRLDSEEEQRRFEAAADGGVCGGFEEDEDGAGDCCCDGEEMDDEEAIYRHDVWRMRAATEDADGETEEEELDGRML